jgi:hypothetical protein
LDVDFGEVGLPPSWFVGKAGDLLGGGGYQSGPGAATQYLRAIDLSA